MSVEPAIVIALVGMSITLVGALIALVTMGVRLGQVLAKLDTVSSRLDAHETECKKRQEVSAEKWLEYQYFQGVQAGMRTSNPNLPAMPQPPAFLPPR